jgi:hypothetical protein
MEGRKLEAIASLTAGKIAMWEAHRRTQAHASAVVDASRRDFRTTLTERPGRKVVVGANVGIPAASSTVLHTPTGRRFHATTCPARAADDGQMTRRARRWKRSAGDRGGVALRETGVAARRGAARSGCTARGVLGRSTAGAACTRIASTAAVDARSPARGTRYRPATSAATVRRFTARGFAAASEKREQRKSK